MIGERLQPTPRSQAHLPRLFHLARGEDRLALEKLLESHEVRDVHDTILSQASEVVESRCADRRFTKPELAAEAEGLVGRVPNEYGTWVFFPWSGSLVHVLPESEFEELRTSRNRNKITRSEQTRLARLRVGIVGLSVGHATAVTLALEGIGGLFRLADFDALALSNLNRLRAGVQELGQNKAVLTARRIFELNPYALVELFSDGVTEENIDAFMGREERLDLVFEECDDLAVKVRLREEARRLRIPVLMETSDRGLLDVERFDREPDRPLFHGLAGVVDARSLRGLTAYEKVPTVLAIVGDISARGAASLVDVEATLQTWPQLASAVALGSGIGADTARRIALGQFTESGRFYVDLERLIADGTGCVPEATPRPAEDEDGADRSLRPRVESGPLCNAELESIVTWAAMAPSGGNSQPWRFVYRQGSGELEFWLTPERAISSLDFGHRGSLVALGAAMENARLAAIRLGRQASLELLPTSDENLTGVMRFGELGRPPFVGGYDDQLRRFVETRATRRGRGDGEPLSDSTRSTLSALVEESGGRLDLVTDLPRLESLGHLIARAERLRMLHPLLHEELVAELRWSEREASTRRDGLDLRTLELTPTDTAAVRLLKSPRVPSTLREIGGGEGLERGTRSAIGNAAAVGLLRRPGGRTREAYLQGGQMLQRLWLLAEANGLGLHPMTGFLYWLQPMTTLLERIAHFDSIGASFTAPEKHELLKFRDEFLAHFPPAEAAEILFFRFTRVAGEPTSRSLRRPSAETLTIA